MDSKYFNLIVVLVIISMFSGIVLAETYKITDPYIRLNAEKKQQKAVLEVMPGIERFEDISKEGLSVFQGFDSKGNKRGIAFIAEGNGFGGTIRMMVGFNPESNTLTGMTVLSHLETPGLGARIQESWFQEQFKGKSADDPFIAKQDIDAISGATISSKAVGDIIKDTLDKVKKVYGGEF